ncbi:hypothetical protein SCALIN_C04_0203 [Candidatus Scalindua japonica]|uniref:Ice-binding protein C-terminal domain-containing protein n=1 Tax=Candidatus Scalindua japonica TaxID=1284222 RepID=A0A286TV55_9BACT|nr:hypothetical protein SCALIN_C04_0203 [Candidatus Scalindua japonica]
MINTPTYSSDICLMYTWDTSSLYTTGEIMVSSAESAVVPEPGTIVMLGIGLAGLGVVYLRRRWREKAGRGREENGSYSTG